MTHSDSSNVNQIVVDRIRRLTRFPIIAAISWQGYQRKGRGFVHVTLQPTDVDELIVARYIQGNEFWNHIPANEQSTPEHQAIYNLLMSYVPETEYIVCAIRDLNHEEELICFDHLIPKEQLDACQNLGLFLPSDDSFIAISTFGSES